MGGLETIHSPPPMLLKHAHHRPLQLTRRLLHNRRASPPSKPSHARTLKTVSKNVLRTPDGLRFHRNHRESALIEIDRRN